MVIKSFSTSVAGFVLAALSPFLLGATSLTGNFEQRILAAHNRERTAMGIPALAWDDQLQASAQSWAAHLATTGRFEHAADSPSNPEGENLWGGTKGAFPVEAMVDGWVREKRYFKPGTFPDNSVTGRVEDIGHYTQLMWRSTRRVGCAMAAGNHEDILVCRYGEAGNYLGERPF